MEFLPESAKSWRECMQKKVENGISSESLIWQKKYCKINNTHLKATLRHSGYPILKSTESGKKSIKLSRTLVSSHYQTLCLKAMQSLSHSPTKTYFSHISFFVFLICRHLHWDFPRTKEKGILLDSLMLSCLYGVKIRKECEI